MASFEGRACWSNVLARLVPIGYFAEGAHLMTALSFPVSFLALLQYSGFTPIRTAANNFISSFVSRGVWLLMCSAPTRRGIVEGWDNVILGHLASAFLSLTHPNLLF